MGTALTITLWSIIYLFGPGAFLLLCLGTALILSGIAKLLEKKHEG